MIKAIIIDDEVNARNTLKVFLGATNKPIEIIGEADDISTGIKLIRNSEPDLIFLDIKLKSGTSFELLAQLPNISAEIIFVTAYDNYAIRAFQMAAFGYLLKPIQISELNQVLDRFEKAKTSMQLPQHTKILIENFDQHSVKKLVIQNVNGFKVVPLEDIFYLQGEVNYTRLFLQGGEKVMTSRTLKDYETFLVDFGFFRIHQSHLINLSHVKEYIKGDGGEIVMNNGQHLNLSRRRKQQFLSRFLGK
ncbi:MAG: LytTR family transcriptional regulator DNA-binding domain-containing protein [Saprospiraceae bacterium]|nr:LytTR family transcriptional regulator DNA-binding domain-containing protein [Saprospiraceae bacterium]